jgi:MYXO-CTERM domain-containing protein
MRFAARSHLLVLAVALLSLAPARAQACSCAEQTFEMAERGAVAIFEARVSAIETAGDASHVRMDVVQTWRAAEHEHVEVVTAPNEAACGYTFEVGRSYLVYASSVEGEAYRVSLCSRTRRMEDADDDRSLLGSGVVPVDIEDAPDETPAARVPPTHAGCASCSVGRASTRGAWLVITLLAMIATRRRS